MTPITLDNDRLNLVLSDEHKTGIAARGDDESRRVPFSFPRFPAPDVDLSEGTIVIRFSSKLGYGHDDVKNRIVADDTVSFDWYPSANAAATAGYLKFSVCIVDENGNYKWHTGLAATKVALTAEPVKDGEKPLSFWPATDEEVEQMLRRVYGG